MDFIQQLEFFEKLEVYIQIRVTKAVAAVAVDPYRSESVVNLLDALSKAQGEYKHISFNRKDSYFEEEYADFDSIMMALRPTLSKYGLSIIQQQRITEGGATMLHTIIGHESGEWTESRSRILPIKEGPLGYVSELNLHKRHALMCLLGVSVAHDNADDNAYVAMQPIRTKVEKGTSPALSYENTSRDTITREQLEQIEYELAEYPDIAKMILDQWKLQALADMPKNKYDKAFRRVLEIKELRRKADR